MYTCIIILITNKGKMRETITLLISLTCDIAIISIENTLIPLPISEFIFPLKAPQPVLEVFLPCTMTQTFTLECSGSLPTFPQLACGIFPFNDRAW